MTVKGIACLLFVIGCLNAVQASKINLRLLGQTSLTGGTAGPPSTEQVTFDDKQKVAYLTGGKTLYVIDLSPDVLLNYGVPAKTPKDLPVLHQVTLPTAINDVAFCGGYLAIVANGAIKTEPGTVTIHGRYLRQHGDLYYYGNDDANGGYTYEDLHGPGSLEQLASFTVGAQPDQLTFSKDCKTILVSNEGEPATYEEPNLANDPEGSVSIIDLHYCDGLEDVYAKAQGQAGAAQGSDAKSTDAKSKSSNAKAMDAPTAADKSYTDGDDATGCWDGNTRVAGHVRNANFYAWNTKKEQLLEAGVKLNGIGASVSQDLEPEFTTFSEDESLAFVSLQENNAIAVLDIESATFTHIHPLGFKDHVKSWNPLDPSDTPLAADISPWPVFGMYQPDEIKSFRYKGCDYIVTANEGDARNWPGLREERRVRDIFSLVDPSMPGYHASLAEDANLGRLNVLTVNGQPLPAFSDPTNTGKFHKLFSFGARSFSIWKLEESEEYGYRGSAELSQVFDSAAALELISREELYDIYNSQGQNSTFDSRSDNKGPEPEGLAVGPCTTAFSAYGDGYGPEERLCLFLGMERLSVIFVYDITDPAHPVFQSWARPPQPDAANEATRLTAPEGITYARYTLGARTFPIILAAYEGDDSNADVPAGLGVYKVVEDIFKHA